MNKNVIMLLLILTNLSCKKKKTEIDFKKELTGKTFKIVNSIIDKDIEFLDYKSITYDLMLIENKYRIEKITDSTARFFFGNQPGIIKSLNSKDVDYILIGEKIKDTILLKETNTKYNLEHIKGNWIEKENLNYTIDDQSITMNSKGLISNKSELRFDPTNKYLNFSIIHSKDKTECLWKIFKIDNDTMMISKSYKTNKGWSTVNNITLIKKR